MNTPKTSFKGKGIPTKLNAVDLKVNKTGFYVIVQGYKDPNKTVGYVMQPNGRFISFINTNFKNLSDAKKWLESK